MRFTHIACSAAFLGAVFACSSSSNNATGTTTGNPDSGAGTSSSSGGSDGGGSSSGGDSAAPPAGSYSVDFGPLDDLAGVEDTKCIVKRLGNPTSMHVGTIHNVLSKGSHHMIVYRVNDTEEQLTPFDCKPFTDTLDPTKGSTIMISQKLDDSLVLPDGVAYTLDANQMVRIEMHYINPTADTLSITSSSTFIPIDDSKYQYEADFLFIGDPDIKLNPDQSYTLGPVFIKLPDAYSNVNFFALTGHEHQYGTNVQVSTATDVNDPGTSVYDVANWLWSEPATVQHNPPFTLPAGGGFKFSCSWNNTSDTQVNFGESANDEMCFFWAYYYPSQGGAKVCAHSDQYGSVDACCPATNNVLCTYLQNATN